MVMPVDPSVCAKFLIDGSSTNMLTISSALSYVQAHCPILANRMDMERSQLRDPEEMLLHSLAVLASYGPSYGRNSKS
jgi:hypothetical protein